MINLIIYNDDNIRTWRGFPTLKDPYVLENTLLKILNEVFASMGLDIESSFNINNPKFGDLYLPYYTISNLRSWGQLPLRYIYNDMVRLIQNQNTGSNYIMTLESIEFNDTGYATDTYNYLLEGEIVTSYLLENYFMSYTYMDKHNKSVLLIQNQTPEHRIYYIIGVGFTPNDNINWFESASSPSIQSKLRSLNDIIQLKSSLSSFNHPSLTSVSLECRTGKASENKDKCARIINRYNLMELKKKSSYDTETKYGNYSIDYNYLSTYDTARPLAMYEFTDKYGNKEDINLYNQDDSMRTDYRLLKKENSLIKIEAQRKQME